MTKKFEFRNKEGKIVYEGEGENFSLAVRWLVDKGIRNFRNLGFYGMRLVKVDWTGCDLSDSEFKYCSIIESRFDDTTLRNSSFLSSTISQSSFNRALMHRSKLDQTTVFQTDFNSARMDGSTLNGFTCWRCEFDGTTFTNAGLVLCAFCECQQLSLKGLGTKMGVYVVPNHRF